MAKEHRPAPKRKAFTDHLPFTRPNYQILFAGLACILLGYWALSQEPWDGFLPLVAAPILLVGGYCVLIPLGILFRKKSEAEVGGEPGQ